MRAQIILNITRFTLTYEGQNLRDSAKEYQGLGRVAFKNLLTRYENPQAVLAAPYTDLIQTEGLSQEIARLISGFDDWQ